jgi:hypothetical protein
VIIGVDIGEAKSSYCGIDAALRLVRVNDWPNPALLSGARGWAGGALLVVIERIDAEEFRHNTGQYHRLKEIEARIRRAVEDQGIRLIVAGKTEIRARVAGYHPRHCGAAKTYLNHWLQGLPMPWSAAHGELLPRARTPETPAPLWRTGRGSKLSSDDRRDALIAALYGWLSVRDGAVSGLSLGEDKAFHVKQSEECRVQSAECKDPDRRIA